MKTNKLHVSPGVRTNLVALVATALGQSQSIDARSSELEESRSLAFKAEGPFEFATHYLRSECLSKFDDRDPSRASARQAAAFEKFHLSEEACSRANKTLCDVHNRPHVDTLTWARAQASVRHLLGGFDLDEFISSCGFGPGASTSLRRKASSQQNKWEKSSHITKKALPYYLAFARWTELPLPETLEVVSGNTVTTVPKNSKIDRVIAIEPDWNMFFQKGVGKMLRRRLRRVGLLMRDSQHENRRLALEGSEDGSYATLDLSAASDSISLAVVEALLPDSWLQHICALRSEVGVVNGKPILYEKVSSMGNGFTFELETLIFWALARAVCEKGERVLVYGDDIIIPTHRAVAVTRILEEAGFAVNESKSFSTGDFRESCGGHYWSGVDVTPFYVRHTMDTICDIIVLHNNVLLWHHRTGLPMEDPWREVVAECRRHVPRKFWGPWLVQGCLWADWDECRPRWNRDYQCYVQFIIARSHRYYDVSSGSGSYLYKLWTENDELESSRLARSTSREKVGKMTLDRHAWVILPVRIA